MTLTDPTLHPLFLRALVQRADAGWLDLDHNALRQLLSSIGPYAADTLNKVQGVKTTLSTPEVLSDCRLFAQVVLALNGVTPDFSILAPPELPELLFGATVIKRLAPKSDQAPFGRDVLRFVAAVGDYRSSGSFPAPLDGANALMVTSSSLTSRAMDEAVRYVAGTDAWLREQLLTLIGARYEQR